MAWGNFFLRGLVKPCYSNRHEHPKLLPAVIYAGLKKLFQEDLQNKLLYS